MFARAFATSTVCLRAAHLAVKISSKVPLTTIPENAMKQAPLFPGVESLTMNDIVAWAGHRVASRGQKYQRDGMVAAISIAADGTLVADVHGSEPYSVMVSVGEGGCLRSVCSCPYHIDCKHGVAALLEYIERINGGGEVPSASFGTSCLRDSHPDGGGGRLPATGYVDSIVSAPLADGAGEDFHLEEYLAGLGRKQLVACVVRLAGDIPQLRSFLREEMLARRKDAPVLLSELRREIRRVTRMEAWSDPWAGRSNVPDYSGVRRKMRVLLDTGNYDSVLAEGDNLLRLGKDQIEHSSDEGETRDEIANCIPLLLEALRCCSFPVAEKISWTLDALLGDDYGVCDSLKDFLEEAHPPAAWNLAAESLAARLERLPVTKNDIMAEYRRNAVSDWLARALERAGRGGEILRLYEAEAEAAGSYKRLVDHLMREGRDADALRWIEEGIRTAEISAVGRVCGLRDCQRAIHAKQQDWQSLLLLEVEEFLRKPDADSFAECRAAVPTGDIWPGVRRALLDFLISGGMPWEHSDWPSGLRKPAIEGCRDRGASGFPMVFPLVAIAIQEKHPEDVARWHAMLPAEKGGNPFHDTAAMAMQRSFPEKSVKIWQRIAEDCISRTEKHAYMEAVNYLRKMQKLMCSQGLDAEWRAYAISLKTRNSRKKRFLELLDSMDERPLLKR